MRVLIADDHAMVRTGVRALLSSQSSFQVCGEAVDGMDAVEKAKIQPDIIILDVMLPGFDGLEVVERVRRTSKVPILMLTAKDTVPDRVAGFESG